MFPKSAIIFSEKLRKRFPDHPSSSSAVQIRSAMIAPNSFVDSDDVIGVELEDRVGNLNQLLLSLEAGNINVDYIYLCFNRGIEAKSKSEK